MQNGSLFVTLLVFGCISLFARFHVDTSKLRLPHRRRCGKDHT
jgi:hypothetical protein